MSIAAAQDLLEYIDLDEFVSMLNDEPSTEFLLNFVEHHPEEAVEILRESWQITQLEMFLEEGNRRLKMLKRKRRLSQTKALQMLQPFNHLGKTELPLGTKRRRTR